MSTPTRPDLDAYWMPFTANRQFKQSPRLLTRADGMYFTDDQGRQILDGVAGLWCVNAGHNRPRIVRAIQEQAVSNCGYIIFNFLNLNAGWIHRIDSGHIHRPYKAPTIILAAGTALAFVNAIFMGAGAKVWNAEALWYGLGAAALIIPVFAFRHYVQDKGQFPARMMEDLGLKAGDLGQKKAGVLPYVVLVAGVAVVLISNWIFTL